MPNYNVPRTQLQDLTSNTRLILALEKLIASLPTDDEILRASPTPAVLTGVDVGTLTNSPVAGDPTTWLKINIEGVDYAIPAWQL